MLKSRSVWFLNQTIIRSLSPRLINDGQSQWTGCYLNRNYCYKQRKNPFDQWDDFEEPTDEKILEKFKSKTKTGQLLKKKEEEVLSNLGLEKYVELFEENLQASSDRPFTENKDDGEEMKHFERFLDERQFKEHRVEHFKPLIDCDETKKRIEQILKDYELEKYNTSQVPTRISIESMEELLKLDSLADQIAYFNYLFKREAKKYTKKAKNEILKAETSARLKAKFSHSEKRTGLEYTNTGAPIYAKWKNTMFIQLNTIQLRKENDRRVRDAILFGPRLVLDFGFTEEIYKRHALSTLTTQMYFTMSEVNKAQIPFHLNLCNLPKQHPAYKHFTQTFEYITQTNCLLNITGKSYLDLFPKQDLIYLSPDAPKTLETVDPNKVHIIGAICDKFNRNTHTYQKAKSEGIPVYKLPLEDYFFFKHDRALTMNLCVGILQKYLEVKDWRKAFIGRVPVRKLKTPEDLRLEQIRKVRKFYSKEKFFKIYKMNEEEENEPTFKPNFFKPKEQTVPTSPRFYNPQYTPSFKIKYTPNYKSNETVQKHSVNHYRSENRSKNESD